MAEEHTNASGFRSDIQALRAVAVLGVVLNHASVPYLDGGYAGVDVFFVISGFLITDHLARALQASGRLKFGEFYARRARRILPASLVVAALTMAASMYALPATMRKTSVHDAIATALYFPNFLFAHRATDYFADPTPSLYLHYWSLGVEEQFYLCWPLILMLAWWSATRLSAPAPRHEEAPRNGLLIAVILVGLASAWLDIIHRDALVHYDPRSFFWPTDRAWEFALGGCAALLAARPSHRWLQIASLNQWAGWIGLACIAVAFVHYDSNTSWPGIHAMLPCLGAVVVILAGTTSAAGSGGIGVGRVLSLPPLPFIGAISYSLYLVHWPLVQLVQAHHGYEHPLDWHAKLALSLLAVPIAWVLYRFIENPIRFTVWLRPARLSLLCAAAASGAIVLVATYLARTADVQSHRLWVNSDVAHVAALTSPPTQVTAFVPRNLAPSLAEAGATITECTLAADTPAPKPCHFGSSDGPRVILWGDSEAGAWVPALRVAANRLGLNIEVDAEATCPPGVSAHVGANGSPLPGCDAWREAMIERIKIARPRAVVLTEFARPLPDGPSDTHPPGSGVDSWVAGLQQVVRSVSPTPVIIIHALPNWGLNVPQCLAAHLADSLQCSAAVAKAYVTPARDAEARVADQFPSQVKLLEMSDYFCGPFRCDPIIGNTLVMFDDHHLTPQFATLLGPVLAEKLAALGIGTIH